jgi:hypothetical protein
MWGIPERESEAKVTRKPLKMSEKALVCQIRMDKERSRPLKLSANRRGRDKG